MVDTIEELIKDYGNPIIRFLPEPKNKDCARWDIPKECCVFSIDHATKVMVASRYSGSNEWVCNQGERAVINFIFIRINKIEQTLNLLCSAAFENNTIEAEECIEKMKELCVLK